LVAFAVASSFLRGRHRGETVVLVAVREVEGILISMSGKGNCYDNAMVETFFKTLKSELVWRTIFCTRQKADQAIGRYIDGFYNPVRRHSALDFTSPAPFEKTVAE
jgi:putative transposase